MPLEVLLLRLGLIQRVSEKSFPEKSSPEFQDYWISGRIGIQERSEGSFPNSLEYSAVGIWTLPRWNGYIPSFLHSHLPGHGFSSSLQDTLGLMDGSFPVSMLGSGRDSSQAEIIYGKVRRTSAHPSPSSQIQRPRSSRGWVWDQIPWPDPDQRIHPGFSNPFLLPHLIPEGSSMRIQRHLKDRVWESFIPEILEGFFCL